MCLKKQLFMYLVGGLALFAACDGVDLTGGDTNVEGLWELQVNGGVNYLEISQDSVIYYFYKSSEGCLTRNGYEVYRLEEGGFYTLTNSTDTLFVAINLSGERIHVRDIDETQNELDKYWRSSVDINSLGFECTSAEDVLGKWELDEGDGNIVYLNITADSVVITNYSEFLGCYNSEAIKILEIRGNMFIVENNDPDATGPQGVVINRIGNTIQIIREEDGRMVREIYSQSDFDPADFEPECTNNFRGMWQLDSPNPDIEYLVIEENVFTFYSYVGNINNQQESDCFEVTMLVAVAVQGDEFTWVDSSEPVPVEITGFAWIDNGFLHLNFGDGEEVYFPNTIDSGFLQDTCQ